jgi:hypothetical protein
MIVEHDKGAIPRDSTLWLYCYGTTGLYAQREFALLPQVQRLINRTDEATQAKLLKNLARYKTSHFGGYILTFCTTIIEFGM